MASFSAQQWAAFAAMAGQPTVGNNQAFQLGGMDSGGVVLGAVAPGYLRLAPDSSQSSVMPGSSLHSAPNPYGSPTLGYALQPSVDATVAGRQLPAVSLPPYLQHYSASGPISQTIPFPHASIPYGQSFPYIQTLLPTLCNGGLSQVQQCQALSQQQAALVPGFETSLRVFDSLKSFGALPQEQNRRNKSMITSETNLYVSGLNESDTDETVRSLVGNVVKPKSCKAMMNNGVCKGYGFIDCATKEDAEKAKNYIMANPNVGGRKLLVKFAHENEKDVLNVYVRHLPADFTKDKLENLFRKYGEITSVKLLENEDRLTGIGFVRYARAEQAERAIEQMNAEQLCLGGNTAPVTCKLADKPNARRRIVNSAHTTSALMSLPLTNSIPRPAIPFGNSSSQRGSMSFSQVSQSSFNQPVPFTQLISQLNQPQVILHNLHGTPVSSNARAVLSPGVLTNGSTSTALPVSFPSISTPCMTASGPTTSHRATPLIGPPPQTAVSTSLHSPNPSTANPAGSNIAGTFSEASMSTVKSPSISSPISRLPCDSNSADPIFGNKFHLCTTPVTQCATQIPLTSQVLASTASPSINPQLVIFPPAPNVCSVQSSVFPFFPCGSIAAQSAQTGSLPSLLPAQPALNPNVADNPATNVASLPLVHLAAADMQSLSLAPSTQSSEISSNGDPSSCPGGSTIIVDAVNTERNAHASHCIPITAVSTISGLVSRPDTEIIVSVSSAVNLDEPHHPIERCEYPITHSGVELTGNRSETLPESLGNAACDNVEQLVKSSGHNGVSPEIPMQEENEGRRRCSETSLTESNKLSQCQSTRPGRRKQPSISEPDLSR